MHFAYKYFTLNIEPDEFYKSRALIELSKWDDVANKRIIIGKGEYDITEKISFYETTEIIINYSSTATPDSMRIVFSTSSDPDDAVRLTVDDIYLQMENNIVGNDDKVYVDQVSLYPNPVNDWLTFINPLDVDDASLLVYNSIGQLLLEEPIVGTGGQLDCKSLTEGIYFYQIRQADKLMKTGKLMKN